MAMRKVEFHPPNPSFTIEQIVRNVAISPGRDAALTRLILAALGEYDSEEAFLSAKRRIVRRLDQLTNPAEDGPGG